MTLGMKRMKQVFRTTDFHTKAMPVRFSATKGKQHTNEPAPRLRYRVLLG